MEPSDLLTLTVRMLEQLDLTHAVSDDGSTVVVAGEDDAAIFIGTGTVTDSSDRTWPALIVALPLLKDVTNADGLSALELATINHNLLVGKVSFDDGDFSIEHEFIGWPGAAEYRVAIESLLSQSDDVREALSKLEGKPPTTYSELVD